MANHVQIINNAKAIVASELRADNKYQYMRRIHVVKLTKTVILHNEKKISIVARRDFDAGLAPDNFFLDN